MEVNAVGNLKVTTDLEYGKIAVGNAKSVQHFLVTLEGSKIKLEDRKPLALSAVIDCSGSMAEDNGAKMEYAKKTLLKLIDNLSSEDFLSCVGFSTNVFEVFKGQKMTPEAKEKAKAEVEKLHPMMSTNLSGGMLAGFDTLKDVPASYDLVRVFLMTDGLPNQGVYDTDGLLKMVNARPDRVTLSTFGYGSNHDPELLASMAKAGKGNFHFIKNPDECPAVFGRELGGLLTCVAQNIKVKVKAKPDVKLLEVRSDFDVDGKDDQSEAVINVDDVYSEERRKVLIKVELPALEKTPPRPFKFADIEADFFDVQAKEPRQEKAKATVEYVKEADAQKEPSSLVQEELARIEAAKAQEEARKFADQGQFGLAQKVIQGAVLACRKVGTETAEAYAADLEQNVNAVLNAQDYADGGAKYLFSNSRGYSAGRGSTVGTAAMFSTPTAKETAKGFMQDDHKPVIQPPAPKLKPKGLSKKRSRRS